MQRWEYQVIVLRGEQYTAALNELGSDGWELVSVVPEVVGGTAPKQRGGFPVPRALGRLEEATDTLSKLGTAGSSDDPGPRLLWIFRRPLSGD